MKTPRFIQLHQPQAEAIRQELVQGLSGDTRAGGAITSPKFLYDALGSRLFDAITELTEYYPTRTEAAIFAQHGEAMAQCLPHHATLVDLGAGNCNKAASLFDRFAPSRYVAVDISVDYLRAALACLQRQYPAMDMVGVGLDFSHSLDLPAEVGDAQAAPRVLFYPGSSIGNFAPDAALRFLRQVHGACGRAQSHGKSTAIGSGLLIGVDLVKDVAELEAAYDDPLGVTAAFNKNLLLHINRLIGSDFSVPDWQHVALYNTALSRIEMHLQARRAVTVAWGGGNRSFSVGERIHTENSYKWTVSGFSDLLQQAGFSNPQVWTDATRPEQGRFAVMWATAQG